MRIYIKQIILTFILIILLSSNSASAIHKNIAYEFTIDNFTITVYTPRMSDRDGNGVNDTIEIEINVFASEDTPETRIFVNSSLYVATLGNWDLLETQNHALSLYNLPGDDDPSSHDFWSVHSHVAEEDGEYKFEYDVTILNTTEHIELPAYYLEYFNESLIPPPPTQDIIWQRTIESNSDTTDPLLQIYDEWSLKFLLGLVTVMIVLFLIQNRKNII